jgi:hypothetical protein
VLFRSDRRRPDGGVNRIILVARVDLVILVAVIANMAIQPGGGI